MKWIFAMFILATPAIIEANMGNVFAEYGGLVYFLFGIPALVVIITDK